MRYKILFISSWFPNKLEPTSGNFVQRHAEAVSLLHDVEVLHAIGDSSQQINYLFDDQVINGVRTLIIYYKNTKIPFLNFLRRMKAYQRGFKHLEKPDLIHANVLQNSMLFAVYLKKIFKIPFLVTEHWSGFLGINRQKLSNNERLIAKLIANNASFVLPVSKYLRDDLMKMNWKTNFRVVGNVVDIKLFQVKSSIPENFIFLHISNLVPVKNPDKIILAAVKLRQINQNFELHIGGDGNIEKLNHLIDENNASSFIKTFSMLTLNEVATKMRNSTCFILFSDYENLPCVLLETLSSGTPAIAARVGGIPEIVNKDRGVLIDNSEEELYQAMKKVLLNQVIFKKPELLHEFVEKHFSIEVIARKFDEIYREILQ
ncbi:glycosyltransferase family 4 protein [Chryseobacterium sp. SNU WT5]|uniref:glycosyltransferase family 4 protein n=1 Tax=Chryseobacterium sp. SNU WT5 TaxID=2594269 RepID=UPI00117E39C0|nr:glycosyltransferase family 4 protein [Chryseobacterium sp. SNU WT5]QDP85078.1 glycosyltransferase family 4 protein [Chryseobacterium sp. SNU WT5]